MVDDVIVGVGMDLISHVEGSNNNAKFQTLWCFRTCYCARSHRVKFERGNSGQLSLRTEGKI